MSWFRYHVDALDNPKIQSLPAVLFKFWVNLLSVSKISQGFLPETAEISFRCRCSEPQAREWIQELKKRKLIDEASPNELVMHDWNQHQFVSDDVTARVRKHRAKRKGNVSVTPPEQSRAEYRAEQSAETGGAGRVTDGQPRFTAPTPEQTELQETAARMCGLHPKPSSQSLVETALLEATSRGHPAAKIEAAHIAWCKSEDWTGQDGRYCNGLPKWINENGFTKKPRKPIAAAEAPEYYNLAEEKKKLEEYRKKNGLI